MKKEDLKVEAKRLRSAIAEMFHIPVSSAQSLELIAKTKNFPSWDAACGSAIQSDRTPAVTAGAAMPTAKSLDELGFPGEVRAQIKAMLTGPAGLYLVAGSSPSGRSTTLGAVMLEAIADKHNVATVESPVERVIPGADQHVVAERDWHETIQHVMRSDPDLVMLHELRDQRSTEVAVERIMAGAQVWAAITSRLPSMDAVMQALRASDPEGRAAKLVQGVVWQSLTDDGRIEARVLFPTSVSIQMNLLKNAADNIDFTVMFLVAASGIAVPAEVQEKGREVVAAYANKGEITLFEVVDAFDRVPQLREWAAGLRKAALRGDSAQRFFDPS